MSPQNGRSPNATRWAKTPLPAEHLPPLPVLSQHKLSNVMSQEKEKIDSMVERTLSVLGGDLSATTPDEGADLVQEWIFLVRSNVSTQWVAEPLEKLRDAIYKNDLHEIDGLMHGLSGMTIDLANNAAASEYIAELRNVSTVLKTFADKLAEPQAGQQIEQTDESSESAQ